MRIVTRSADETRAVGARVAGLLQPGDLVIVGGSLGSGKTVFVQGLARGLDVEGPVTSPTFTLVHEYKGRMPLLHADVYRLDRLDEVRELALEERADGAAVTVVEWGDVVEVVLPEDRLEVRIELPAHADPGDERLVALAPSGPSWNARADALTEALFGLDIE